MPALGLLFIWLEAKRPHVSDKLLPWIRQLLFQAQFQKMYIYLLHISKTLDKEALSPSKALTISALIKEGFEANPSRFLYQQQNQYNPVPPSAWPSSLGTEPTAVNHASSSVQHSYFELCLWNYVRKNAVVLLWFLTKALSRSAAEVVTDAVQSFSVPLFTVQFL